MQSKPDDTVEFEHMIRGNIVYVKASIWGDELGIYKTLIDGVYVDGVEIMGLMRDDDLDELYSAIQPALDAENADRYWDFVPERDAHRLGD